mgnify:CR=1 FL=1
MGVYIVKQVEITICDHCGREGLQKAYLLSTGAVVGCGCAEVATGVRVPLMVARGVAYEAIERSRGRFPLDPDYLHIDAGLSAVRRLRYTATVRQVEKEIAALRRIAFEAA